MTELPEPAGWRLNAREGLGMSPSWLYTETKDELDMPSFTREALYTADQMRTAIQQERVRVVDLCAEKCDDLANESAPDDWALDALRDAAKAIRALKEHP